MPLYSFKSPEQRVRFNAICIVVAATALLIGLVVGLVPNPWKLIILGALVVGVGTFFLYRTVTKNSSPPAAIQAAEPITQQLSLPPDDEQVIGTNENTAVITTPNQPHDDTIYDDGTCATDERPRRNKGFNHLKTDENGVTWLCIARYIPISQGFLKKKTWKRKEWRLKLDESIYVNQKLAKRVSFTPTDAEDEILWLRLPNWWSHGPSQVGMIFTWLVTIAVLVLLSTYMHSPTAYTITGLVLTVVAAIWYMTIWIKWRSTFQMITNRRVFQLYQPPFNLPDNYDDVGLEKLTGGINKNSTWWGRFMHYGTVKSETSADKTDKWIKDGIKYVSDPEVFASILSQAKETAETEIHGAQ